MFDQLNRVINSKTNTIVIENYSKLRGTLFILPLFLLVSIVLLLNYFNALSVDKYVEIQKSTFLFINYKLAQFPTLLYNLTQFGDELILLSFLSLLIITAPRILETVATASIVSLLFSRILKGFFSIPRPAQIFNNNSFIIVGRRLPGFSSLPSGHSITVFTIFTILLFAFMPKKNLSKIAWTFLIVLSGLLLVFTRVGVGAHYPIDVISGSIIGYISALIGIFISRKYNLFSWIYTKHYIPICIFLLIVCSLIIDYKISTENLLIYYFASISLLFSIYKISYAYFKK